MEKLTFFNDQPVTFVETVLVKPGVSCDVYSFSKDSSKDLGIVTVSKGSKTPLQKVLKGDKTIECFVSGVGRFTHTKNDGSLERIEFSDYTEQHEIEVKIGETMQWEADANNDLVFYEICHPPYQDGRFENISD